jgi:lipoprotein-anchoring transpeptidase ErfK/SrfK
MQGEAYPMAQGVAEVGASIDTPAREQWVRGAWWALVGFALSSVLLAVWLVAQTVVFASAYDGRILPGAEIAGVDVSGLTEAEAAEAVGAVVDPQLDRTVRLVHLDRTWETTPRQLGATSDADAAVAAAVAESEAAGWRDLFTMRWLGRDLGFVHGVRVAQDEAAARALVDRIAGEINLPVREAAMDYSTGMLQFTPEQTGRAVANAATTTELVAALSDGREVVQVQALDLHPRVTMAAFNKVLFLRQSQHRLYLFQNGVQTHSWLVATGTGGFPTPRGEYSVSLKRYMPTWVNPDPEGWGKDMPPMIPPGATNPLGLRALNWSGGGAIRFHGTSDIGSLGSSASHGCVRLANRDVVQLYDLVDVGTKIISVR